MRTWLSIFCLLALLGSARTEARASSNPVVVLRGGEVITLKEPWTVKGSNAILTRIDGTVLSVPVVEIDRKATAARMTAPPPPPPPALMPEAETPAEAVRAGREKPRARVRITDADVGHQPAFETDESSEKAAGSGSTTPAKIEVADYTQDKAGNQFAVRGSIRNVGTATASSVRMIVFLLDEKGNSFAKRDAGLETTTVEGGHSITFSAAFDVGNQSVAGLRFQPFWIGAPLPPPPGTAAAGPGAAASNSSANGSTAMRSAPAAAAAAPTPAPTPYGRGLYYAPAAPPVSSTPPADGNGYLPGAARSQDQPKPPQ